METKFKVSKSSASHDISDILQITFGANSSRFWILRKHINTMERKYQNAESMPFFAWQCISLTLAHRDVDIVIRNQKEQNNLVKFLLYKMNTIDGRKDSAKGVIKVLEKQAVDEYKRQRGIRNKNFKMSDLPHATQSKVRLKNKM